MKKVCGTCNLAVDQKAGNAAIEVLCANDNEWRPDSSGCPEWKEIIQGLSSKDRIDLANSSKVEESIKKRHDESMLDSQKNRKHQFQLAILAALGGVVMTLLSQFIWSLWMKP